MIKIIYPKLAGKKITTSLGPVVLDKEGMGEVSDEMGTLLLTVPGFYRYGGTEDINAPTTEETKPSGQETNDANWDALTLSQLRAVAQNRGIQIPKGAKKAEVVALLKAKEKMTTP